jgi:hypothetical protein
MNQAVTSANPAAQRARRYRDRKKEGMRCIQFRVSGATIDMFVRLGLLEPHARHDRRSIEGVFYGLANVGLAARDVLSQLGALRPGRPDDYARMMDAFYSGCLHWQHLDGRR